MMKNTKLLFSALVSAATLSCAPALFSADLTWAGSDGGSWDYYPGNWLDSYGNSTSFATDDNVTFGSNAEDKTVVVDDAVRAGTITVSGAYTFSSTVPMPVIATSLTVSASGSLTLDDGMAVEVGSTTAQKGLDVDGTISGGGTLNLFLTNDANNKINLGKNNGFTGMVWVVSGSFSLSDSDIGSGMYSIYRDVTMRSSKDTEVSNNIELDYGTGTRTLTVDSGTTLTLSGELSDEGGINKQGAGTLVLRGANTYEGGTTISAGTLVAANASALGTETVTIDGGQLSIADGVELNKTTIAIVLSEENLTTAAIDGSGSLAAETTIRLSLDDALAKEILASGTELEFQILGGDLAKNSSGITVDYSFDSLDGSYEWSYEAGVLTIAALPEPSAFGLLAGLGALAFVAARRRRGRKAA